MSETPIQIISVTTQARISRRVHRYRLALREAKPRGEGRKGGRTAANGLGWEY